QQNMLGGQQQQQSAQDNLAQNMSGARQQQNMLGGQQQQQSAQNNLAQNMSGARQQQNMLGGQQQQQSAQNNLAQNMSGARQQQNMLGGQQQQQSAQDNLAQNMSGAQQQQQQSAQDNLAQNQQQQSGAGQNGDMQSTSDKQQQQGGFIYETIRAYDEANASLLDSLVDGRLQQIAKLIRAVLNNSGVSDEMMRSGDILENENSSEKESRSDHQGHKEKFLDELQKKIGEMPRWEDDDSVSRDIGTGIGTLIKKLYYPQKADSRQDLIEALRSAVSGAREVGEGKMLKSTWFPPSPITRATGILLPGQETYRPIYAFIVDTSGSISANMLDAAASIIYNNISRYGEARVIVWDDGLHVDEKISNPRKQLKNLMGGGGTSMEFAIDYAISNYYPHLSTIFVLTDGLTSWESGQLPRAVPVVVVDLLSYTREGRANRPSHPHIYVYFKHEKGSPTPRAVLAPYNKVELREFVSQERIRLKEHRSVIDMYKEIGRAYKAKSRTIRSYIAWP
ncbi:MAG: VWA-like domain-containing protein, partial [Candidatus Methanomethylicaceae archaeon]